MNPDLRFFLVGIVGGIITLFVPVILWNVIFLDYINTHGKLWAFVLAPVFAGISAAIFAGAYNARRPVTLSDKKGPQINPFYGWGAIALLVEFGIVLLSNR